MKNNVRRASVSLFVLALAVAFCFFTEAAFAGTVGGGAVAGDASGTISATTPCAMTGDFSIGTGILLLDEGLGPASGLAAVVCNIGGVTGGAISINDPASIDGGAISDILDFTNNSSGGTTVSLYSVGENGFTQADANAYSVAFGITEFNTTGGTSGYTVYGGPTNGGLDTCAFSSTTTTVTVIGCSGNAYIINSPEEAATEPGSFLLLGIMLIIGLALGKRVLLPESK